MENSFSGRFVRLKIIVENMFTMRDVEISDETVLNGVDGRVLI